jgi:alkylation response protein AidB-like acyl-CoA dehydrogenase
VDFGLSEEQELLQETVRTFARGECPAPRLREIYDSETGYEPALWRGLAELGIAGLIAPEKHGGAGLELLDAALVAEALGGAALPSPYFGHTLACLALRLGGSAEQQARWLPRLASGEALGTVALGEREHGWRPADWQTALTDDGLSGRKDWVPFAAQADLLIVGTRGDGLAVVECGTAELEAVDGVDRTRPVLGARWERAPAEPLTLAASRICEAGSVLLAADAFGAAWKLIEMTRDYVQTREQFGQPLARFQAVKHQLADMLTETEPTRALWWFAAHAFDHRPAEASLAAAQAKAHGTDVAMEVARGAFELHGGLGFTWECDVQFWFKRALFDRTFLGTPDFHLDRSAEMQGW